MTTAPTPAERPHRAAATHAILVLALIGLLAGLARYRLLDVPLERDEGGFAVMGRLILDGVPPYAGAYDYKPPGLYLAYAAFIGLFGGGPAGIHFGLLLTSLGSMVLVFALVKRWSGETGALVAAFLSQAFLASTTLLGFAAHATHFVVFWSLAGFLLLERGLGHGPERGMEAASLSRSWWLLPAAGAAFGAATLMKQPGAVFFLAALAAPFLGRDRAERGIRGRLAAAGLLAAGFVIPLAAVAGWLSRRGLSTISSTGISPIPRWSRPGRAPPGLSRAFSGTPSRRPGASCPPGSPAPPHSPGS
jgi:4-amino-4-deoxy-L-arabinose transferase-like glycosyltransferase